MAKPTDEAIDLPDWNSNVVQKVDGAFKTQEISLKALHAEQENGLIVYFYPKDNTSGCTVQAQDFTAMKANFAELGYAIIGISRDSIKSHEGFIDKQALSIPLASDEDEKLCQHFDVIKEKNMYGKKTLGLVRSTFVFDKDGKLTHAQRNLRAKGYGERLYETLAKP